MIWAVLILLLLFWYRKLIKNSLIVLYFVWFNKVNESYPVFPKIMIGDLKAKSVILANEWSAELDKLNKERGSVNHKDIPSELRNRFKETWEKYYLSQWYLKESNFMIEANIDVIKHKMTIEAATKIREVQFSYTNLKSFLNKASKQYISK